MPTKTTVEQEHSHLVNDLAKPGIDIRRSLSPDAADIWHGATGIATEAGELLDAVKKLVVYGKPLDRDNIIEELGDLEFYMEQVRQNVGVSRHEVLRANIEKLRKRYGSQYSNEAAIARADKEGAE